MNFLIPLGLLGLTSIIVLIIIYIIKPKFHEKAVSSTVIWKLSLKYQKPRMPLQWLKRSLLFTLQLLILVSLALMLARPFITLKTLSGEKVVILDASAGMLAEKGGKTRFDRAVDEIIDLAEDKQDEDRVTVILAGGEASYVIRRADSASLIRDALENVTCSYGSADIEAALELAGSVLDENPKAEVILYTDHSYEQAGYVTVKDLSDGEWNAAVTELNAELKDGYFAFTADVASYGKDAKLEVSLYIDGEQRATKTVEATADLSTQVTFWDEEAVRVYEYADTTVTVNAKDSFTLDNTFTLYGNVRPRYVELISEYPTLLNMALMAGGNNSVFQATLKPTPKIYESGYDLYVYEGKLPSRLPNDGAVILINPEASTMGLRLANKVTGSFTAKAAGGISKTYQQIMNGVSASDIQISQYTKLASYDRDYEVLMSCNKDPVVMAKDFDGIKVVVVLFDLHYSDLPLLLDFPVLIHNLCDYAAPATLPSYLFTVGDDVEVNAKPNASSVSVLYDAENGDDPVSTDYTVFPVSPDVSRPGSYTVIQTLSNGNVRTDRFFVRLPAEESDFSFVGGVLAADEYQSSASGGDGGLTEEPRYNILEFFPYIAVLMLVLLVVEWGVQYREQF